MKVKVRKYKKAPSMLLSERMMIKNLALSSPNLYSAVQNAIRDISSEKNEPVPTASKQVDCAEITIDIKKMSKNARNHKSSSSSS